MATISELTKLLAVAKKGEEAARKAGLLRSVSYYGGQKDALQAALHLARSEAMKKAYGITSAEEMV